MILIFSFLNGLHHGLGVDHMMAVTTLAGRGGSKKKVSWLGLKFGLGHMAILLVVGSVMLLWDLRMPAFWQSGTEILGGSLLILLGLWTLVEWLKEAGYAHSHRHSHRKGQVEHTHFHIHLGGRSPHEGRNPHEDRHPHEHVHLHSSTLLGALFALSGLRSILLPAVPILQTQSLLSVFVYVFLFGAGVVVSMGGYGWIAGSLLQSQRSRKSLTLALGCLSIGLGLYWVSM